MLRLAKTASPRTVAASGTVTYHLKVTNPTSVAIKSVKVCDTLPLGLSFSSAKPKANLSAGRECWTVKRLGARSSRTFTVHARALKGTSGRKTNHATARARGVATVRARATVRVKAAPKHKPTPVTD